MDDGQGHIVTSSPVTLTVNAPPVAANDTATTNENTAVAVNVLANDSDPDGTLNATTVAIVGAAAYGTTSVDPTSGIVTYTPASNYTGPDSFTYEVQDNLGRLERGDRIHHGQQCPTRADRILASLWCLRAGTTIPITVAFGVPVSVTGTPQLALNAGTGAVATYSSGSGTRRSPSSTPWLPARALPTSTIHRPTP